MAWLHIWQTMCMVSGSSYRKKIKQDTRKTLAFFAVVDKQKTTDSDFKIRLGPL